MIKINWNLQPTEKENYISEGVYIRITGDAGSIAGSEIYSEEGNGTPLQYSCLENPMDRGAWQATVMVSQGVKHD